MKKINSSKYCPVCGFPFYDYFGFYPWRDDNDASFEICPCCSIHFGNDDWCDSDKSKRDNFYVICRKKWIHGGSAWDKGRSEAPKGWNPQDQLKNIISNK